MAVGILIALLFAVAVLLEINQILIVKRQKKLHKELLRLQRQLRQLEK